MNRVLVAYGTKRGSTKEIAERIGTVLSRYVEVDVRAVKDVHDVAPYSAVIVGSPIYAGRWKHDVVRFLRRHRRMLKYTRVWLFHSGPLADVADVDQPLPANVFGLKRGIGAHDVVTFGGCLERRPSGLMARMVASRWSGDYRDFAKVEAWANEIGKQLSGHIGTQAATEREVS
jgi:menaquinone-dependent protoporphyrinogen oxidase